MTYKMQLNCPLTRHKVSANQKELNKCPAIANIFEGLTPNCEFSCPENARSCS